MTEVIYPSVMGLFCTGYVLHLIWRGWERRHARKFFSRWDIQYLDSQLEIVWARWDAERGK